MEQVCTRLTYTLCIGIIALIGYAVNTGDGKEGVAQEWAEKMVQVEAKMQELLHRCT